MTVTTPRRSGTKRVRHGMPIYCINLRRSADRRRHMEREFSRLGWDARIVRAIDGCHDVDVSALISNGVVAPDNESLAGPLSSAEIGCYLSHERVWRAIRKSGDGLALVCEDDISFRRPPLDLHALTRAVPADGDIVYLHYLNADPRRGIASPFDPARSTPVAMAGSYAMHSAWSCGGTQCYCLTAGGAEKALASARPIRFPVDGYLARLGFDKIMNVHALFPMPAETGRMPSTIHVGSTED